MPSPATTVYAAFGLRIASAMSLDPYLARAAAADAPPDLLVASGAGVEQRTADSVHVEWPGLARVHVRGGRDAWAEALVPGGERIVAEAVAGPGLAIALAQRGFFVLHASAVSLGGRAVAVAGHSGAGKSTLAALLVAAGGRPLSDDITPLTLRPDGVDAVAGPTLSKLEAMPPAAARHAADVGREAAGTKRLYAWTEAAAPGERVPLAAVLLVEDAPEAAFTHLRGQQAVAALLRFAFCLTTGGPRYLERHLRDAAAIAPGVRVARLARPRTVEGAATAGALVKRLVLDGDLSRAQHG